MRCCGLAEVAWSRSPGLAEAAGRVAGRAVCGRLRARAHVAASESGSGAGPSRRKSGVRRAWTRGPSVQERAAGKWPEPMGRWSAESDALGLVQSKGRWVPGEVGRARVKCLCVKQQPANPRIKMIRGRILVLTARAPDFDVYQPPAVWIRPVKSLDET
jgi:hypothetical protein